MLLNCVIFGIKWRKFILFTRVSLFPGLLLLDDFKAVPGLLTCFHHRRSSAPHGCLPLVESRMSSMPEHPPRREWHPLFVFPWLTYLFYLFSYRRRTCFPIICPKNCSGFGYSTFLITVLTGTDKIIINLEHGNKVKSIYEL